MFPLQVFEEGETSKTFKAGGAKSFEGGRREGEEGVEGEEVGGGERGGGRRRWGASGPGPALGSSSPISLGDKQPCTRVEPTKAPELNPPKHHLHQGRGKMHQT